MDYAVFETLFILLFCIFIFVFVNKIIEDKANKKFWSKPIDNFPFHYRGKTLWYSRSVAVTLLAFAKDKEGKLYVLANKRGKGCPDYNGYWNLESGYLQYNCTGEDQAVRECKEETGIDVNPQDLEMIGVSTSPTENKQNVSIRYRTMLPKTIDEYTFDLSNMEKDEVEDVKFIPIDEVENYEWAFNHKNIILGNLPK